MRLSYESNKSIRLKQGVVTFYRSGASGVTGVMGCLPWWLRVVPRHSAAPGCSVGRGHSHHEPDLRLLLLQARAPTASPAGARCSNDSLVPLAAMLEGGGLVPLGVRHECCCTQGTPSRQCRSPCSPSRVGVGKRCRTTATSICASGLTSNGQLS